MADIRKVSDLTPDKRNANKGTERGLKALDHSLRQYGAGRSILLDKNGRIIAGNKTAQAAAEIGLDDVILVQTDGTKLVAVQRTDLDLEQDKAARELAYADNRVGQLDLDFDVALMLEDVAAGVNLDALWRPDELEALVKAASVATADEWGAAIGGLPVGEKAPFQQMTFTVSDEQAEQAKAALDAAKKMGPFVDTGNENSNGNALARVCEVFLNGRG